MEKVNEFEKLIYDHYRETYIGFLAELHKCSNDEVFADIDAFSANEVIGDVIDEKIDEFLKNGHDEAAMMMKILWGHCCYMSYVMPLNAKLQRE